MREKAEQEPRIVFWVFPAFQQGRVKHAMSETSFQEQLMSSVTLGISHGVAIGLARLP